MSVHTLYAYVDGSDLNEVASALEEGFDAFVSSRPWSRKTWVVNQRHPCDERDGPRDLPLWELGLNHELPDPGTEVVGWFDEVEEIAQYIGDLAKGFGRQFVVGIAGRDSDVSGDLRHIATRDVDLPTLRAIVGIKRPSHSQ